MKFLCIHASCTNPEVSGCHLLPPFPTKVPAYHLTQKLTDNEMVHKYGTFPKLYRKVQPPLTTHLTQTGCSPNYPTTRTSPSTSPKATSTPHHPNGSPNNSKAPPTSASSNGTPPYWSWATKNTCKSTALSPTPSPWTPPPPPHNNPMTNNNNNNHQTTTPSPPSTAPSPTTTPPPSSPNPGA